MTTTARKTRVLIVDDSAIVRKLLADTIRAETDMEVVGVASDAFVARDLILKHEPDVITLDIEMPRMDGLTFLKRLMQYHPLPVIIVSSITQQGSAASIEALRAGAVDVIAKPGGPQAVGQVGDRLKRRIRALRASGPLRLPTAGPAPASPASPLAPAADVRARAAHGLIALGASTGGTQAIETLLTRLPRDIPPMVVVQHMPPSFTKAFADRLNGVCPMRVVEAQGGETLERGTVYIAPGDYHMIVERFGLRLRTALKQGPPVHYQRPAVDVMFHSVARLRGTPVVGVLLTGMGADGADGMVALREAGAETIAEDEQSCVVFGMPKEAIARGGATHVATLLCMPSVIFDCFERLANQPVA